MATKLDILLVGETPVAFCEIGGHRNGCTAHLRRQAEFFLTRESLSQAIEFCTKLASSLPSMEFRKVTNFPSVAYERFLFSVFHFLVSLEFHNCDACTAVFAFGFADAVDVRVRREEFGKCLLDCPLANPMNDADFGLSRQH